MIDLEFIKKCLLIPTHEYNISIAYNQNEYNINANECQRDKNIIVRFPVIWNSWKCNYVAEESNYQWKLFKEETLIKYDPNIFELEYLPGNNKRIIGYIQFKRLDGKINHDVYYREGVNSMFIDIPGDII